MGEYIQRADGVVIKLGTLEDLFYVSLPYLRELVDAGATQYLGNLPPADYLDAAGGWRYRFPWPDEAGTGDDFNRAHVVTVPAGWYDDDLEEHNEVSHYLKPIAYGRNAGGYGVNVFTACPLSATPPERCSEVPQITEIYEQKQVDGLLWTICRCPYCGAMWRIWPEKAAALVDHLRAAYAKDEWTLTIADLVEAGYAVWYWDKGADRWRAAIVTELTEKDGYAAYIVGNRWGYAWQIAPRWAGQDAPAAPDLATVEP